MHAPSRRLSLSLLLGLLASCGPSSARGLNIYRGAETHPRFATGGKDSIQVSYLGVGGYVIRRGEDAILFAPFFTNPPLWEVNPVSRSQSDTAQVDRCMSRMAPVKDVRWLLTGHSHYDHLMDVPRVMTAHAPDARVVGSRTVRHILAGAKQGLEDRTLVIDACAASASSPGKWLYNEAGTVRVLAIESDHSAHWWIFHLMGGRYTEDLEELPRTAWAWRQGETYAYLVDFLHPDGSVAFRIHYQDAASSYPRGFVPAAAQRDYPRVDLSILCMGAYATVQHYPSLVLKNTQPRYILLGHWEDFFGNQRCMPEDPEPRVMRLSDIHEFIARVEQHKPVDAEYLLPAPYTTLYLPLGAPSGSASPPPVAEERCPVRGTAGG